MFSKLNKASHIVVLAVFPGLLLVSCTGDTGNYNIDERFLSDLWSSPSDSWHIETDPEGDYFEFYVAAPEIHDVLLVAVTQDIDLNFLVVSIEFNEQVVPGTWSGLPEQLFGYVEIDADQDASTGIPSNIDNAISSNGLPTLLTNMGVDYFVSLHEYEASFQSVTVYKSDLGMPWEPAGMAHALFQDSVCLLEIPLAVLGDDDGNIDFGLYIGTEPGLTDITHRIRYTVR
jgi:hypothetical protein